VERVLIVNGPNLALLGEREPDTYGSVSLPEIEEMLTERGCVLGIDVTFFQSNDEGAIIDALHDARTTCDGVVLNAGALTHYSYALRDAVAAIGVPVVEVHLSNIFAREPFRATSVIAPACIGSICGFGPLSYLLGLDAVADRLRRRQ
jgi:3-dehydroquinate dehydratase-2